MFCPVQDVAVVVLGGGQIAARFVLVPFAQLENGKLHPLALMFVGFEAVGIELREHARPAHWERGLNCRKHITPRVLHWPSSRSRTSTRRSRSSTMTLIIDHCASAPPSMTSSLPVM